MIENTQEIVTAWIYIAAVVSFCQLLTQFFLKVKNIALIQFFLVYTSTSTIGVLLFDGKYPATILSAGFAISVATTYGPTIHYLTLFMTGRLSYTKRFIHHYYFPLFIFILFILGAIFWGDSFQLWTYNFLVEPKFNPFHILCIVGLAVYLSYFYRCFLSLHLSKGLLIPVHKNYYGYFLIFSLARLFVSVIGLIIQNKPMMTISLSLNTFTAFFYLYYTTRYPKLFQDMVAELNEEKHRNISIDQREKNTLLFKLQHLMEEDRIFCKPNLKVGFVAEELGVYPQKLTKLLWNNYRKNFNEYVNGYRIEYAKELLTENPNYTILYIGFESGFNSKSVFNDSFKRLAGMTPRQYRQMHSLQPNSTPSPNAK